MFWFLLYHQNSSHKYEKKFSSSVVNVDLYTITFPFQPDSKKTIQVHSLLGCVEI